MVTDFGDVRNGGGVDVNDALAMHFDAGLPAPALTGDAIAGDALASDGDGDGDAMPAPGVVNADGTALADAWLDALCSTGAEKYGPCEDVKTLPQWIDRVRSINYHVDKIRQQKQIDVKAVAECQASIAGADCCRLKPAPAPKRAADAGPGDGDDKPKCANPRAAKAQAEQKRLKDLSYWIIAAGDYSAANGKRRLADDYVRSGMVFAELDKLDYQGARQGRDELFEHAGVLCAYVSSSGAGVHAMVAVTPAPYGRAEHAAAWHAVCEALGLPVDSNDRSVKHPNRMSYLSYDPDARIRQHGDVIMPVRWELPGPAPARPKRAPGDAGGAGAGDGIGKPAGIIDRDDPLQAWHPLHPKNRSVLALGLRFFADWRNALVIASDGDRATLYRADAGTGLLSATFGEVGGLLAETLATIASEVSRSDAEIDVKTSTFSWIARQGDLRRAYDAIVKNTPAILKKASESPALAERMPALHAPSDFDADPGVIGCQNGAVDMLNLTMLTADEARGKLVTVRAPWPWIPGASHPACEVILPAGDMAMFYGWALAHAANRDIIAELSAPGSGKTTRKKAMLAALGEAYVTETRAETFQQQKYNRGGTAHNAGVFALRAPARFCFVSEIAGDFDVVLLNKMSGNEGRVSGRAPGIAEESFKPMAHLVLQGNLTPEGSPLLGIGTATPGDRNHAFRERLRVFDIPDLTRDERDQGLVDVIHTPEFGTAMLAYLIRLAHAAPRGNEAPETETMAQRLERQVASERPDWVTECLLPSVVVRADAGAALGGDYPLDGYHARQAVLAWFADNGDPKYAPAQRRVTNELIAMLGKPDDARRAIAKRAPASASGRVSTPVWDSYAWQAGEGGV